MIVFLVVIAMNKMSMMLNSTLHNINVYTNYSPKKTKLKTQP